MDQLYKHYWDTTKRGSLRMQVVFKAGLTVFTNLYNPDGLSLAHSTARTQLHFQASGQTV